MLYFPSLPEIRHQEYCEFSPNEASTNRSKLFHQNIVGATESSFSATSTGCSAQSFGTKCSANYDLSLSDIWC